MDTSLMYGYHDQPPPARRKKSKKRRQPPAATRGQQEYYEDDYSNWGHVPPPPPPPPSASSIYMNIQPYPYPGAPDDLDLQFDAMSLYSSSKRNTNASHGGDNEARYDYGEYARPFLSPQYYRGHPPPPHLQQQYDEDPMMFDNFYQGGPPAAPMILSRQSSSRISEPYHLPHSDIPPSRSDDHLMMADYPDEEMMMMDDNDRWYPPIRPDLVQRNSRRRKAKRPQLQRSHSIGTTAPHHYHEPPPPNEMYLYPMVPEQQPYFQQSISAPNSPGNRLFNEDEDMPPGLRRSTSMQGPPSMPPPPMMMNGPPQRRHSYFEPNNQPSPDFMRPVVNSAPGTPWMSSIDLSPPGVLPTSMPTSSSSLKQPPPPGSSHSDQHPPQQQYDASQINDPGTQQHHPHLQQQQQQQQPKQQQQQQQQQHGPPLDFNNIGGNPFPKQQQPPPMMNRSMQHGGGGMNMPLPTPPLMGLPPYMGHQGPHQPPMWNNNDMMGHWDPMMMGSMAHPPPPPFGYPGGGDPRMMMNPIMGGMMNGGPMGPMMGGGMMPPMPPGGLHEELNNNPSGSNKKSGKEDKKANKDSSSSKDTPKEAASMEPVSITEAAEASKATLPPASAAVIERQLPPLHDNAMVRRKPSIWNLFGIGGNRSMMTPYGMPTHMPPYEMMMADLHHGEHPKLAEMVEKFQQLMYVWCYVTPMENYQTAWCTFKIQNQRKLNHADRHGQRTVTLDKEKGLPGTVIVNPLSKTAVMYKSLWSTTKMIITIMRLPQEEYRRQQHALSPELMRRWGSKRRNPGYATGVFNSMFRDYPR